MDQYPTNPVFDPILRAEHDCRTARTVWDREGFRGDPARGPERMEAAQEKLYALIDALSLEELKAYGEYRKIFAK
jgi:hypothetical protein